MATELERDEVFEGRLEERKDYPSIGEVGCCWCGNALPETYTGYHNGHYHTYFYSHNHAIK